MPVINYERAIHSLCDEIYEIASDKGFWDYEGVSEEVLVVVKLALIHSEVSEALETHREEYDDAEPDPVTGLTPMQEDDFLEELADVVIRVFDLVGSLDAGNTFGDIILSKMEKNRERPYRHGKKY